MVCCVSMAGAALAGTVSCGATPNPPETSTPTTVMTWPAARDVEADVEFEPHPARTTPDTTNSPASRGKRKRTTTPFEPEIVSSRNRAYQRHRADLDTPSRYSEFR